MAGLFLKGSFRIKSQTKSGLQTKFISLTQAWTGRSLQRISPPQTPSSSVGPSTWLSNKRSAANNSCFSHRQSWNRLSTTLRHWSPSVLSLIGGKIRLFSMRIWFSLKISQRRLRRSSIRISSKKKRPQPRCLSTSTVLSKLSSMW